MSRLLRYFIMFQQQIERECDEMDIPHWIFASNPPASVNYNDYLLNMFLETIENNEYREILSRNSYEDTYNEQDDEFLDFVENTEPLIPNWLYQEENHRRHIVQETDRVEMETNERFITVRDYATLYPDRRWPESYSRNPFGILSDLMLHTTLNLIEPFKQSKTIEKAIDKSKNTECPITYEDIKIDDAYMTCFQCKYNFSEAAIMKYLNEKRSCPMCRCYWIDDCRYINMIEIPITEKNTNILKNIHVIDNVCNKEFTKNYNILGEVKGGRYNKRWNYGK